MTRIKEIAVALERARHVTAQPQPGGSLQLSLRLPEAASWAVKLTPQEVEALRSEVGLGPREGDRSYLSVILCAVAPSREGLLAFAKRLKLATAGIQIASTTEEAADYLARHRGRRPRLRGGGRLRGH